MSSNIIDVILRLHDGVSGGLTAMQGKFGAMQKTLNTVGNDFTRTGKKIQIKELPVQILVVLLFSCFLPSLLYRFYKLC